MLVWLEAQPEDCTLLDVLRHLHQPEQDDDDRAPSAVPTHAEVGHLLQVTADRRDRLAWRLLYATGVRRGELVNLRWADRDGRLLFIRSGKGPQDRYVLLDEETSQHLDAWGWNQPPERPIIDMSVTQVWKRFAKWTEEAGLAQQYAALGQRLSPHSLRHSYATRMWEAGLDPTVLQLLLGHSLPATTGLYVHPGLGWAERYHRPLTAPATLIPRPLSLPSIYKAEVLALLRDADPEDAPAPLLALHQLGRAPAWQREGLAELQQEMGPVELVLGERLPYVPPLPPLTDLGLRFLRRSGARQDELPILGTDPATGLVQVAKRMVVVEPDLAAQLTQPIKPDDTALRATLTPRYAAMGRRYTPLCLRHCLAAELVEKGLDLFSMHAVLGNYFVETTERCVALGIRRWLPEYDRCHPWGSR